MRLSKHHGLGNDFLVALVGDNPGLGEPSPEMARRLCDRRRGIGADGLIFGLDPRSVDRSDGDASPGADLRMVLLNSDGSRAEISGNGIRCLAQAEARRLGGAARTLRIAVDGGVSTVEVAASDGSDTVEARVDMGSPGVGPAVPADLAAGLGRHATVDMGNPHLVVEVPDPDEVDLATAGPATEAHFAEGVNVEFVRAADGMVDLRVWERGAGITEACGSGACAAAVVARRWGLVGDSVAVRMPGGDVIVEIGDTITLVGPATHIADIEIELSDVLAGAGAVGGEGEGG